MTTLAAISLIFIVGIALLIAMMRSAAPDPDDTVDDEFPPTADLTALLQRWEDEDERDQHQ